MELQEMVPGPKDIRSLLISYRDQWTPNEFQNYTKTCWCTLDELRAIIFKLQFLFDNTEEDSQKIAFCFSPRDCIGEEYQEQGINSKQSEIFINGLYFLRFLGPVMSIDWSWNQLIWILWTMLLTPHLSE